jgi:hypothetical protein
LTAHVGPGTLPDMRELLDPLAKPCIVCGVPVVIFVPCDPDRPGACHSCVYGIADENMYESSAPSATASPPEPETPTTPVTVVVEPSKPKEVRRKPDNGTGSLF